MRLLYNRNICLTWTMHDSQLEIEHIFYIPTFSTQRSMLEGLGCRERVRPRAKRDYQETVSFGHSRAAALITHSGCSSMLKTMQTQTRSNPSTGKGVRPKILSLAVEL